MGCSSNRSLIEQAKEELEILEFQHPNRFQCLKMELKSFISDLESQNMVQNDGTFIFSAADTQESSNRKKRKKIGSHGSIKRSCCKTEAVLERAQQCLHKIQHFKTHFYM